MNYEQRISNDEGSLVQLDIQHSLFMIRYSFLVILPNSEAYFN